MRYYCQNHKENILYSQEFSHDHQKDIGQIIKKYQSQKVFGKIENLTLYIFGGKGKKKGEKGEIFKNRPVTQFLVTIGGIKSIAKRELPPFPKRA